MTEQHISIQEIKRPSLTKALIWAAILVFIDAFLMNQGAIAALVGFGLLVIGLPRAFLRKFASVRAQRLRNLGIYGLAVGLVFGLNALNNRIARNRADMLVAAVQAFQAKQDRYPQSLNELVPDYIESIPLAKYTLGQNKFYYRSGDGSAFLYYVALPPFGRPTYWFSANKWGYMD